MATKFGIVFGAGRTGTEVPTGWGFPLTINGTPAYARTCVEESLKRLGTAQGATMMQPVLLLLK